MKVKVVLAWQARLVVRNHGNRTIGFVEMERVRERFSCQNIPQSPNQ